MAPRMGNVMEDPVWALSPGSCDPSWVPTEVETVLATVPKGLPPSGVGGNLSSRQPGGGP